MNIRKATKKDLVRLYDLLETVQTLHAEGRPDIFVAGTHKYTLDEIGEIIENPLSPVYVLVDGEDLACGYAFCQINEQTGNQNLHTVKNFYIDDLCVREDLRGKGYGKLLYDYAIKMAKEFNCYHLTLNVWHLNESALKFYEKLGMKPLKTTMETIL